MLLMQAAVLGVVQGLTEFLPVSSSGHLLLVRQTLGWELLADVHLNKMFDVGLHAGTFLGLLAYFCRDLVRLLSAFLASLRRGIARDPDRRLAWLMLIATLPAVIAGLTGQQFIEAELGAPLLVSALLIFFGIALWVAERAGRKARRLAEASWWDGILVGLAQALALAPGVSRSGITITAGLARGMARESAARFSFLLSLPIVGGTAAYGFLSLVHEPASLSPESAAAFMVGMAAAALSGYLCIRYFLAYLQARGLGPFILYRLVLGAAMLAWFGLAAR